MGVTFTTGPVWARVPATSANLGPGFDSLGLALGLHDELAAEIVGGGEATASSRAPVTGDAVRVTVTGEGAGELPTGEAHLTVRAMQAAFAVLGGRPAGLRVTCHNRIPQARGLGSSSAAIVGGILLARELVAGGSERLDQAGVLRLAARLEGHPDNVAPCLLGGFTVAWTEENGHARAVSLEPAQRVRPVVFIPEERGLTAVARAALPDLVPHPDAALTAGRAALLVHALATDTDLLFPATEDRIHQRYRAAGMPDTAALVAKLRDAGVAAVVSGAGPSVLALSPVPEDALPGPGWAARNLPVDRRGAVAGRGIIKHAERDPVAVGRAR